VSAGKVVAIVVALFLLTWALAVLFAWRSLHSTSGVAAVSFSINALVVEALIVAMMAWLGWRSWRTWQRLRKRPPPGR
jgi:hypothetical protein